jgi:hypothetical protein
MEPEREVTAPGEGPGLKLKLMAVKFPYRMTGMIVFCLRILWTFLPRFQINTGKWISHLQAGKQNAKGIQMTWFVLPLICERKGLRLTSKTWVKDKEMKAWLSHKTIRKMAKGEKS